MVCKNIRIMEVLINVYSFGGSFNKHLKTPSEKKELVDLLFKVNFGTSMVRLHSKIVGFSFI